MRGVSPVRSMGAAEPGPGSFVDAPTGGSVDAADVAARSARIGRLAKTGALCGSDEGSGGGAGSGGATLGSTDTSMGAVRLASTEDRDHIPERQANDQRAP
jgi:hypothetical protein